MSLFGTKLTMRAWRQRGGDLQMQLRALDIAQDSPYTVLKSDQTMASTSGAEFLEERLKEAQAVPAAERDADVAAFIEGVQLEKGACRMLPLPGPGRSGTRAAAARGLGREAEQRKVRV